MYTLILINIAAIALAQRAAAGGSLRWLKLSFALIFLFLALRYDWGNDYQGYLDQFTEIRDVEISMRLEPGWQFLLVVFKPLGFFALVAAISAFNCFAFYRFVARYVPPAYYGFAVFLYVFNPYFMLVHASAIRQSLAIAMFLVSIEFIERRELLRYALCVSIAASFHVSALVLAPIYFVARFREKFSATFAAGVFAAYVLAVTFVEDLKPYADRFIETYAARYDIYQTGAELGSGLGFVYGSALLLLILLYARQQSGASSLLFKLVVIGYFASVPLGMINTMATRIGMYFNPAAMAVIPILASSLNERRLGGVLLGTYASLTLYTFYSFLQSDVWRDAFLTYQTIFSAPQMF